MSKLFPVAKKDAKLWESSPKVDASFQQLSRQVVLPLDDSIAFKDAMGQRNDTDLKRIFFGAGFACRPAVTLTSVARALRVWANDVESTVRPGVDVESISLILQEMKISADFVAEGGLGWVIGKSDGIFGYG